MICWTDYTPENSRQDKYPVPKGKEAAVCLLGIMKDALEVVVPEIERLGFSILLTWSFCLLAAYSSSLPSH